MRLWHIDLIKNLPRQQLLGQHRECCALRGNGWGKPHSVINYVFNHPYYILFVYHKKIMEEMFDRGYKPNLIWFDKSYRGKNIGYDYSDFTKPCPEYIYPEHNSDYFDECIENLKTKGIFINLFII